MTFRKDAMKLLRLLWRFSKSFYVYSTLRSLVLALKAFVGVYGLSLIIQGLVSNSFDTAFLYAVLLVAAEMIIKLLEVLFFNKIRYERESIMYQMKSLILHKLMNVEFQKLEDPDFLETTNKSHFAIDNLGALHRFMDHIMDMITNFIVMVSLIGIIIYFNPVIIVIILGSILIQVLISMSFSKMQNRFVQEIGPLNRRLNYFTGVIEDARYQKDFRLYESTGNLIYDKLNEFLYKTNHYLIRLQTMGGKYQMFFGMVNYAQITALYLFIGYMAVTQGLGVATYVLLTASAMRANTGINDFARSIFGVRETIQYLKASFDIIDEPDSEQLYQEGEICTPFESLRFEDVHFTYPNTEKEILKGVSFTINKGDKISIVGLNGAGKTTIVKLIGRFYQPTSGTIYWNDKDIHEYEYSSYIDQISAVFQDFKLFALTLSENVDLKQENKSYIRECLDAVSLHDKIESLPHKEESYLSKEYSEEGIELSGGERQKVAIARAMYKNSSFAILDEPTSALDPLSEAEIYEHFSELVKDKTTIYISHRMSSSIFCDKIIVIEDGIISDIDTHQNLMKHKKGMYFELFDSQSNYYI